VYVTKAATGEQIPHPLSRKTNKQTLADGTTIDVPEGMVYVPAGEFTMGEGESEHRVYLDAYFIGKYEVTNAEWKVFCDLMGFTPLPKHWKDGKIPEGRENHPVVNVSWEDTQKYCEWVGKMTGRKVKLPSNAQWEKAARGPKSYRYPWGNDWNPENCNCAGTWAPKFGLKANPDGVVPGWSEWSVSPKLNEAMAAGWCFTTPVGAYPRAKSGYGCYDMAGNVQEWCVDWCKKDYYKLKDANENPQGPSEEQGDLYVEKGKKGVKTRSLRGGTWFSASRHCNSLNRGGTTPTTVHDGIGFRVVVSGLEAGAGVTPVQTAAAPGPAAPSVAQPPASLAPRPSSQSFDGVYVTTAATGEKIPHPLSRKTNKQTLADGTSVDVPDGMVYVPQGDFLMGRPQSGPLGPQHKVWLDDYYIGKYKVTNAEWKAFVEDTWRVPPLHWKDGKIPEGRENHPVVNVTYNDATDYCKWINQKRESLAAGGKWQDGCVQLPTEAQWEKAAAGPAGLKYTWGNEWDSTLCNNGGLLLTQLGIVSGKVSEQDFIARQDEFQKALKAWEASEKGKEVNALGGNTTAVGAFPRDKSGYGCYDMVGLTGEWCADWAGDYPADGKAERNPQGPSRERAWMRAGKPLRVLRGGGWRQILACNCATQARFGNEEGTRRNTNGFRIALVRRMIKAEGEVEDGALRARSGTAQGRVEQPPVSAWDDAYVATAGTGEKIPHPLSRKTLASALPDGTSVNVPEGMVYIPAGEFTMGEGDKPPHGPAHSVYLDAYFIGKYEVTNAEWKAFTEATGFARLPSHWMGGQIPEGKENHPVVCVSWEDAQKYCDWIGTQAGRQVRLPTEAQWEKAASWDPMNRLKNAYPWGNQWDKELCNNGWLLAKFGFRPKDEGPDWWKSLHEWIDSQTGKEINDKGGNTLPVGSFPQGRSAYGCYDMAGNASEWCWDWYRSRYYRMKSALRNPEGPDEQDAEEVDSFGLKGKARVFRGGCWINPSGVLRGIWRHYYCPSSSYKNYCGFRVAVSAREGGGGVRPVQTGAAPGPAAPSVAQPPASTWDEIYLKAPRLEKAKRILAVTGGGYFPVLIQLKNPGSPARGGGDLLAVVRGGAPHVGAGGRLDVIRSKDGGKTWSAPKTVADEPPDSRNPAFGQAADGRIVLLYSVTGPYVDGKFVSGQSSKYTVWLRTSEDNGETWSGPQQIPITDYEYGSPYGRIVQLKDGTLLANIYVSDPKPSPSKKGQYASCVYRSKDGGRTWGDPSLVAEDFNETALCVMPDGRVIAMVRSDGLSQTESADGGHTWSAPRPVTGKSQHPADVIPLKSGKLLLTYGFRILPYGVQAMLSSNGGATWDHERRAMVEWNSANTDCGYPSSVQLADGTILTMHYGVENLAYPAVRQYSMCTFYKESDLSRGQ
jgi:formylglycine-generating enzyme required for sulfatase activity